MNQTNRASKLDRDERLRRLLREADPAAGMEDLAPEEIAAMRRVVLRELDSLGKERPVLAWRLPALRGHAWGHKTCIFGMRSPID